MADKEPSAFLTWLKNRLGPNLWTPAPTREAELNRLNEMPRFPIRAALLAFFGLALLFLGFVFWEVGNPLAAVHDARRGVGYNRQPLTSLAVAQSSPAVWVGSAGGGIKTYDARLHYFRQDITVESSQGVLAGNFIQDLAVQTNDHPLAAIALAGTNNGPAGVQVGSFGFSPKFWARPVVGLGTFDGISDTNASCVAATEDQSLLFIGTRGRGLGIYDVSYHSWAGSVTMRDGLPSDVVNDIVAMPGSNGVVWIGTADGLCGGRLNGEGRFTKEWLYTAESGLAGRAVKRLLLDGTNLWYVTDGGGLGRLVLQPQGSPVAEAPGHALITERSIPGFQEASLDWVRGSSHSRDTWFTGQSLSGDRVGRHRERPYDTVGVALPGDLRVDSVQCAATDPGAAQLYLLGSGDGAYFFATPVASNASPAAPIVAGSAGLEGVNVIEAAISGDAALVKHQAPGGAAGLRAASVNPATNWSWTPLVGTNRFAGLQGNEQVLSAASDGRRVFLGTEGKGIGVWERKNAEMRLEYHSSFKDAAQLRSDTSLDLAYADGTLVQVTGDHAVDALTSSERVALVPSGAMPMSVADIVAADAMGPWLVCAAARRAAQYDMRSFSWEELPALSDVERLALSRGRIWAVTSAAKLFHLALAGGNREWTEVLDGVTDWAVNADSVHVLARHGVHIGLHVFDGADGRKSSSVLPVPREGGPPRWRFAALQDEKLWLVGEHPRVEIYDLEARAWSAKDFPEEIQAPLVLARRSARAWWFLDRGRALHAFEFADRSFDTDVQKDVEQMDAAGDGAVALLSDSPDSVRLVRLHDGGGRETLVGAGFGGDLSRLSDLIEDRGELIAAQGSWIGRYAWREHGWKSFQASVDSITRFHQSGATVWAEARGASGSSPYALGADALTPVRLEGDPIAATLLRADAARLLILSAAGSVLSVAPRSPTEARPVLSAEPMPGTWPSNPQGIASLGGWLAVADGSKIHFFGSSGGPAGWKTVELQEDVVRLCASPREQQLMAVTASSIYVIDAPTKPAQARKMRGGGSGRLAGASVSDTDVAGALLMPGETGARVWVASASDGERTIIGEPLPPSAATKTVLEPKSGQLLRLDTAGRVGSYQEETRSWQVENAAEPLEQVWLLGQSVMGWSRQGRRLLSRQPAGDWALAEAFAGRIEAVQDFPGGLVLQLSDGALAWQNEQGSSIARPARAAQGFPVGFGPVTEVAEFSNVLYLLDRAGRLALFDWGLQKWCGYKGATVQRLIAGSDGVFVVEERAGQKVLSGPVAFSTGGADSRPVPGTVGAADFAAAAGQIYYISAEGALFRARAGFSEKIWSGPMAPAVAAAPVLQAALRVGGEPWLIVGVSEGQSALLRVESASLASSFAMLPPGRVEKILSLGRGGLYASLVSTNGRFPVSLSSLSRLAEPQADLDEIVVRDRQLLGLTATNAIPFDLSVGWRRDLPLPAINEEDRASLRATEGDGLDQLPLVPAARGWNDPATRDGSLAVAVTNAYLLPAPGRLALAHESATGLATDGTRLFVATPGGVLEFDPASSQVPVALRNQCARGPMPEAAAVEWADALYGRTASATWRLQDQIWVVSEPPSAAARAKVDAASSATLKNWRRVPGNSQAFQRRFGDQWRPVALVSDGFNFERTVAAEIREGLLSVFTPAGTLVFKPDQTAPGDLLPSWAAPAGLLSGTVTALDERTSLLAPANPGLDRLWVRGAEAWEPAGADQLAALARRAARPFLETKHYLWERPRAGATVEPVTERSGTTPLAGFFRPESGRFAWETCLQLGQAHGEHWILTPSGLLRIGAGGLDLSSVVPLAGAVERLTFAPTSGEQPGALVQDGRLEWIFDQAWKPARQVPQEGWAPLLSHGHISAAWRIQRTGVAERALPQSPGAFAPVRLQPDRRWDFETAVDVAGDGQSVAVATAFGVSVLQDSGGLKELWPMSGVRQVAVVNGLWQAESADGRRELRNARWSRISGAAPTPLHPTNAVAEGAWFRIERQFPGVALQFRPKAGAPFRPLAPGPRRFPFDDLIDAAIASAQSVASATKGGLITRFASGDIALEEITAAKFSDDRFFCRVPDSEGGSALYARDGGGAAWIFQQAWRLSPQRSADAVFELSRRRLALGRQWHVSASPAGEVEFALHFADEPPDVLRRISLASDHTGFAVDRFTSVATSGGNKIILGSQGGLQRLDAAGAMQRLWGDGSGSAQRDGIPMEGIERTVSDSAGAVQVVVAGKHYMLGPSGDAIRPSSPEVFNRAVAERHLDPNGWRVEMDPSRKAALALRWKGEAAFLVDQPGGGARFGHNLVNAALPTADGLWLATQGGLVILPSAAASAVERMTLVVKPFLPGNPPGQETPAPLTWLGRSDARGGVLVGVGGPRAGVWQGSASSPAAVAPVQGPAPAAEPIARDDLVVWNRPGPGRAQVSFAPGWVFPETAVPRIQNGTFTFVDLNVPGPRNPPGTLASTTNRFAWSTRAGLLTMDRDATNRWRLQTETEARVSLADAASVVFDAESGTAWASCEGASVRLEAATGSWMREARPELFNAKTPRTAWAGGERVRPRLLHTDASEAPWLADGKPAIDRVSDATVVPATGGAVVLVASAGGVVAYHAETFAHVGVHAAAFQPGPQSLAGVAELAWWSGEGESAARLCARSNGRGFERIEGKWTERTNVAEVFESSYRRVRQTNQWNWSRHPAGLSVELPNVNGDPVWLGRALDRSRLPIFSRGRVSIDDVRCLAFAGSQLLLGSAVGVVRLELVSSTERARFAGLDLWASSSGQERPSPSLTNLAGLFSAGGILAWNAGRTFTNHLASRRAWSDLKLEPAALFTSRSVAAEQGRWAVESNGADEFSVRFHSGSGGKRFYVPAVAGRFQHVFQSRDGLWVLSGNVLYHCSRERLDRAD